MNNDLRDKAALLGLSLEEEALERFETYYYMLIEKNKVMNLTAITEREQVTDKHFIDSLCLVKAYDLKRDISIIDVGSGAGFPGIPLKIAFPHLKVTLIDSLKKRVIFLNEVIERLGLTDIQALHFRAEDAATSEQHRQSYDLAVSRAVANLSTLSEYCLPLVKKGGSFIAYKSAGCDEEIGAAKRAISLLGGRPGAVYEFELPGTDIGRSLVSIEKVKDTPGKYPRKAGTASKMPL